MDKPQELIKRSVANIIPNENILLGKLRSGKKLNIYMGIDPTSTKLHLGHAVPLRKLQQFADLGHNVTFIIGDFTALIGDTSDKDSERPALTKREIDENFKTYKKQAEKILDFTKVKIRYNSEWLKKLTFEDIIKLSQHFSVGDFVGRELIKKRISANKRVGLHEFLYPVMQGYDSFMLDTDVQVGGTDQTFNMQAGRTLIKDLKNKESFVLTTPILEGPDGRKMSKSYGNGIWLDDSPSEKYRKIMAINDNLIIKYLTFATDTPMEEIVLIEKRLKKENPINIKKDLAFRVVKELDGEANAKKAQEDFERIVQKGELPENIAIIDIEEDSLINENLLVKLSLANSRSDAKRLFEQNAVKIDGRKIKAGEEIAGEAFEGLILSVGKKTVKLRVNKV